MWVFFFERMDIKDMFVFRKKHFALILCFLFLSFSFYTVSQNVNQRSYEITQVTAIPADGKVIVVDAGHRSEKMVVLLLHLK